MAFSGAAAGEWQSGRHRTQQYAGLSSFPEDQTGAVSAVAAVAPAASSSRYNLFITSVMVRFMVLKLYLSLDTIIF